MDKLSIYNRMLPAMPDEKQKTGETLKDNKSSLKPHSSHEVGKETTKSSLEKMNPLFQEDFLLEDLRIKSDSLP